MILTEALIAAQMFVASLFGPMVCTVEAAPQIEVNVKTDAIDYDYSQPARTLAAMETGATSPYLPGADTVTGGLRQDHPTLGSSIDLDIVYSKWRRMTCMRYKKIDIEMHLRPKIFVAREYDTGTCRAAVLQHELKHVKVDREVANKYAGLIAQGLQGIVNRVGATGPFAMEKDAAVKAQMAGYITAELDKIERALEGELRQRQEQVDRLEEYRAVGSFCKDIQVER